jgi:hypothetical protein
VHNKDHPIPELDFNLKRDRLATSPQDNFIVATLVPDMSINKDQEPDPAVTFNNHIDSDHKTTGDKDFPMHSDRFELNLWVL